jgi:hypothetical protein
VYSLENFDMKTSYALAFMFIGVLAAGQATADKPPSPGSDRKSEQRGPPERAQGRQQDAFDNLPSSAGSDRKHEQQEQSEHTRGRQQDDDATADRPSWSDSDREREHRRTSEHAQDGRRVDAEDLDRDERSVRSSDSWRAGDRREHFADQHRTIARDFYSEEFRRGHCPPGLARKQNGCMPPGLAKKWSVGQQLPRDAIFHNLPQSLSTQLGQAPAGTRYVQIADDILLISSRTGMVIDALSILGNR